ncbi:MAG: hypothetical protein ACLVJ6_06405 [Merdibacter sp.]
MNLQTILRKIRRADQDYHLIEDGDVIGVGVSGGKDSMVLLCALQMYSRFRDKNFGWWAFISKWGSRTWIFHRRMRLRTMGHRSAPLSITDL